VPAFLAQMRKTLYEKNALKQEGLFRLAGDELEMNLIKKQVSDGSYTDCIDVNAVATLIKVCLCCVSCVVCGACCSHDLMLGSAAVVW
jgi:hypothetical protein